MGQSRRVAMSAVEIYPAAGTMSQRRRKTSSLEDEISLGNAGNETPIKVNDRREGPGQIHVSRKGPTPPHSELNAKDERVSEREMAPVSQRRIIPIQNMAHRG